MNASRLYPGMCDDSLEFFYHEERKKMMAIKSGQTQCFDELDGADYAILDQIIDSDHKLRNMLKSWFPNDRQSQRRELAKCRFGGLNYVPDISACCTKTSHDYIKCPLRGKCKGEGIVCKSLEYGNEALSQKEITIIQMLASERKNHEIAFTLNIPVGTFNALKTTLYEKLKTHNKQDITRVGVQLGIC